MFYLHVDVEILQFKGNEFATVYKSIKQSYVSKQYFEREEKAVFLLISDISIK